MKGKKNKKCKKSTDKVLKFAFGGIENPDTALYENQIDWAKATLKADDGLTNALDLLGAIGMQVGSSIMQQGMSKGQGVSSGGFNWGNLLNQGMQGINTYAGMQQMPRTYATGGKVINVEGGEIVETPNGVPIEMVGPSHAQGGIDITIPKGTTEIFSKRVKGPDGKTMAARKKAREKQVANLQKELAKDPTNKILQKTLEKVLLNNEIQEQEDLMIMQNIRNKKQGKTTEFADGGVYNPAYDPSLWNWSQMVPNPNLSYIENTSNFGSKFGTSIPSDFYDLAQNIAGANNYNLDFSNKDSIKGFQGLLGTNQDGVIGNDTYSRMQKYVTPLNITPTGYDLNENTNPVGTVNTNINLANFIPSSSTSTSSSSTDAKEGINWNNLLNSGLSFGDMVGIAGNIYSMTAPMRNTLKNRAGDTPNINAFKDYGKEGLQVLDKSKQYVNQIRDQQLKSLETSRASAINRGRNSARGINTLRAMDLATDMATNQQKNAIFQQFAQAMMGILGQEAQMENQQDAMVMQGEQQRDLADRQDRDNFYSQMAQNIANIGTGLQKTGKDINQVKTRNVTGKAMNNMFNYAQIDPMTGELYAKSDIVLSGSTVKEQIASYESQIEMTKEQKEVWDSLSELEKWNIVKNYKK